MNPSFNGQRLLDLLTSSSLFDTKVFVDGQELDKERVALIFVWSSGSAEQLEAMMLDCLTTNQRQASP